MMIYEGSYCVYRRGVGNIKYENERWHTSLLIKPQARDLSLFNNHQLFVSTSCLAYSACICRNCHQTARQKSVIIPIHE
jgi:hypothetical protein